MDGEKKSDKETETPELIQEGTDVANFQQNNEVSDGFGSLGHELEVDASAMAEAEKEKAEADNKPVISGPVIATNEKEEKKAKSLKRSKVLVVIVLLLMVCCGVGAYFLLLQPQDEVKHNETVVETPPEENVFRMAGNELSDFDLNFLKMQDGESNVVYSPLSIKYALAMLKDGADGESKKQIEDIIGDYKPKKYINSKNISLANAMFIRDSYKEQVLDNYIDGLKTNYNADVIYDSFSNAKQINNWVSNKTLNLVNNVLKDDDVQAINYALVNALAIDQYWVNQLQCNYDEKNKVPCKYDIYYRVEYEHEKDAEQYIGPYINPTELTFDESQKVNSSVIGASFNRYDIINDVGEDKIREKVAEEYKKWLKTDQGKYKIETYSYDKQYDPDAIDPEDVEANVNKYIKELQENYNKEYSSTDFSLYVDDDVKVFAKDLQEYDGNTLQYVGMMPKNGDLKDFVKELNAEKATEYINDLKELKKENFKDGAITIVDAKIPHFEYKFDLELNDDLAEMGVKDVFSKESADLSKMVKGEGNYIDNISHAATIDFSNEGIKAGAATILSGLGGGGKDFDYLWDVPIEKIDLTFDKPFLYLIRDKNTGEVWFVGTVYEPLKFSTGNHKSSY